MRLKWNSPNPSNKFSQPLQQEELYPLKTDMNLKTPIIRETWSSKGSSSKQMRRRGKTLSLGNNYCRAPARTTSKAVGQGERKSPRLESVLQMWRSNTWLCKTTMLGRRTTLMLKKTMRMRSTTYRQAAASKRSIIQMAAAVSIYPIKTKMIPQRSLHCRITTNINYPTQSRHRRPLSIIKPDSIKMDPHLWHPQLCSSSHN